MLRLFEREIYPQRRVVAHFLTHGVTRERLVDQIRQPADAIYRDATPEFTGDARLERLTRNLVRALQDEPILLVLDNFETNLKPQPEPAPEPQPGPDAGPPVWACQDPAWDGCLAALAQLAGSPSRVLVTSRRPPAALAGGAAHAVLLGPLPAAEAALYLGAHPALSRMVFGPDAGEKALALRLLDASRFHPLLMDRLARLAADPALRTQLLQALDTLERTKDFARLPALFATRPGKTGGDPRELAYLNDALAASLDQLLGDAGPDARRLLWLIALANEPVALGLLEGVWGGESLKQQQLRQIKQRLDSLPRLPPEARSQVEGLLTPEVRAMLDALPPAPPPRPGSAPLRRRLVALGLATEEGTGPDDANPDLACHELVRGRICAWMAQHPQDRGEWAEDAVRLAYVERLEAVFDALQHRDMTAALQAGSRALVYCVQAGAWERLGGFASGVVTSTSDPRLLEGLIPHLKTAAESAPEGRPRWRCLGYLADALRQGGRPDAALPFYEQAATQARAAAKAGGEGPRQAWSDLAWISGNWANALGNVGNPDAARRRQIETAEASRQAGSPAIDVIGSELEALRIDILQDEVDAAMPQVEARLARVAAWWQGHQSGQAVPEAPDAGVLARTYISALNIAVQADFAREAWASALDRLDAMLEVKRALGRPAEDIAGTRMNRANVLKRLDRFAEARAELEACLEPFRNDPARSSKVLSSLAVLFDEQGDPAQAIALERRALALNEQLPDPADRAVSHNNLANSLDRQGAPSALAGAPRHQLAALIYRLVARLGQDLQTSRRNYAIDFHRARAAGTEPAVPRLPQLLADPAFAPLDQWLRQRQVDLDQLQAAVDDFLDQIRLAAATGPTP